MIQEGWQRTICQFELTDVWRKTKTTLSFLPLPPPACRTCRGVSTWHPEGGCQSCLFWQRHLPVWSHWSQPGEISLRRKLRDLIDGRRWGLSGLTFTRQCWYFLSSFLLSACIYFVTFTMAGNPARAERCAVSSSAMCMLPTYPRV